MPMLNMTDHSDHTRRTTNAGKTRASLLVDYNKLSNRSLEPSSKPKGMTVSARTTRHNARKTAWLDKVSTAKTPVSSGPHVTFCIKRSSHFDDSSERSWGSEDAQESWHDSITSIISLEGHNMYKSPSFGDRSCRSMEAAASKRESLRKRLALRKSHSMRGMDNTVEPPQVPKQAPLLRKPSKTNIVKHRRGPLNSCKSERMQSMFHEGLCPLKKSSSLLMSESSHGSCQRKRSPTRCGSLLGEAPMTILMSDFSGRLDQPSLLTQVPEERRNATWEKLSDREKRHADCRKMLRQGHGSLPTIDAEYEALQALLTGKNNTRRTSTATAHPVAVQ